MRHILYVTILVVLLMSPFGVLGIFAHFQSVYMRSGHGSDGTFTYSIALACVTIVLGIGHVSTLILDLNAATSGVRFRQQFAEKQKILTIMLTSFWFTVVAMLGFRVKMETIGGCLFLPRAGYALCP